MQLVVVLSFLFFLFLFCSSLLMESRVAGSSSLRRNLLSRQSQSSPSNSSQNNNNNRCNLCQHSFVIILGTGRSGSTTLMEMTNELPGYDIAGEHDGILIPLYQAFTLFHENIKNNNKNNITTTSTTETILTKSQYLCWMQDWFYRTAGYKANFTGSDVHGFKEIRYGLDTKLLNFLAMELFPCAKFVVNYRLDIVAQHQSSFQQQVDLDVLTNKTIRLQSFAQQYSKRTFEMPLEYYHNISQWNALFAFLGRPKCVANSVLHANADGGYNVDTRSVVTCHH